MGGERRAVRAPSPSSFGRLLRRVRQKRGWSLRELSRRSGFSGPTLRSFEAGRTHPVPWRIPGLARTLAVPEEKLARLMPPRPTIITPFGRTLRELRERRGITQLQLARRIGCAPSVVSHYEVGGTYPAPGSGRLGAIAKVLGVPQRQLRPLVREGRPKRQRTPFGRLLRETRKARGLTQRQLAKAVGVAAHIIGGYEKTHSYPPEARLPKLVAGLARVLDLPPTEIEESLSQPRPRNVPTDFGHRLRQLRTDRDLTQSQLARQCGLIPGGISRYETGVSIPKPSVLPMLAKALDVEVGEFEALLPRRRSEWLSTPFGNELRRLRKRRGLSQTQLGRRAGVCGTSISEYEINGAHPIPRSVAAFERALGVSPGKLERLRPVPPETTFLARELKRLREKRGLTQEQLAERIGCSQGFIWGCERDLNRPDHARLAALARVLGFPKQRLAPLLPKPTVVRGLKRLRQERGLSQTKLAKQLGCKPVTIYEYECGRARPGAANFAALARALDVSQERLKRLLPPRQKATPLGRELQYMRWERGLTQEKLAARIGCRRTAISNYERGRIRPQKATIAALTRVFGVSQRELERRSRRFSS